jgi:hypothetical protein
MYIMLDGMYATMSISTGLCPDWDLWTANKLQLQRPHPLDLLRTSNHKKNFIILIMQMILSSSTNVRPLTIYKQRLALKLSSIL